MDLLSTGVSGKEGPGHHLHTEPETLKAPHAVLKVISLVICTRDKHGLIT